MALYIVIRTSLSLSETIIVNVNFKMISYGALMMYLAKNLSSELLNKIQDTNIDVFQMNRD